MQSCDYGPARHHRRRIRHAKNHDGIEGLASRLTMDDRVVMESRKSVWANLYDHLDALHIPVVLANPLKTKAMASARIKSDETDARILAHLLRADLMEGHIIESRNDPILQKLRITLKTEYLLTDASGYNALGNNGILAFKVASVKRKWWTDMGQPTRFQIPLDHAGL